MERWKRNYPCLSPPELAADIRHARNVARRRKSGNLGAAWVSVAERRAYISGHRARYRFWRLVGSLMWEHQEAFADTGEFPNVEFGSLTEEYLAAALWETGDIEQVLELARTRHDTEASAYWMRVVAFLELDTQW